MKQVTEVVAALIWRTQGGERQMLICRRPAHKARGLLWEFAGGKVEPGESPEQALVRECREELAVSIVPEGLFAEVTHEYPDVTVHLRLYGAALAGGEPCPLEHQELRWITPDEIPQYAFCPADEELLRKIRMAYAAERIPCGRWRHYKGREYEVLGIACHSESCEPMVVYRAGYGDRELWVRPAAMWNETVEQDGTRVPRFALEGCPTASERKEESPDE